MFQLVVGEIGRDRREFLYEMKNCEIVLIVRGYRRRNILQYQLQRMQIHAATFCMGNPNKVKPTDLVHLYCDDYISQNRPEVTEEEIREMQELIAAANAQL